MLSAAMKYFVATAFDELAFFPHKFNTASSFSPPRFAYRINRQIISFNYVKMLHDGENKLNRSKKCLLPSVFLAGSQTYSKNII